MSRDINAITWMSLAIGIFTLLFGGSLVFRACGTGWTPSRRKSVRYKEETKRLSQKVVDNEIKSALVFNAQWVEDVSIDESLSDSKKKIISTILSKARSRVHASMRTAMFNFFRGTPALDQIHVFSADTDWPGVDKALEVARARNADAILHCQLVLSYSALNTHDPGLLDNLIGPITESVQLNVSVLVTIDIFHVESGHVVFSWREEVPQIVNGKPVGN